MASLVDLLRDKLDVRDDSGDDWLCICPWHPDTSPSLRVNVKKGLYICMACNARGGRSSLLARLNISPNGPRTDPSQLRARVAELRSEGPTRPSKGLKLPEATLTSFGAIQTDYWDSRGFSREVQEKFQLGYDLTTDAGTIPVRSPDGELVAIIRRMLNPEPRAPKYRYQRGFPMSRYLWGAWAVETRHVAICEGPLDAVALWDAGVPAVALMGCRLSRWQESVLKRIGVTSVILFLDNDRAGAEATGEIRRRLSRSFVVASVDYGGISAKDPGELTIKQRVALSVGAERVFASHAPSL